MTFSDIAARSYHADNLIRKINVAIDNFEQAVFTGPLARYEIERATDAMLNMVDELEALDTDPGAVARFREDIDALT